MQAATTLHLAAPTLVLFLLTGLQKSATPLTAWIALNLKLLLPKVHLSADPYNMPELQECLDCLLHMLETDLVQRKPMTGACTTARICFCEWSISRTAYLTRCPMVGSQHSFCMLQSRRCLLRGCTHVGLYKSVNAALNSESAI